MNFELTKTEQLFRQMIREFAENEVKPLAAEIDEEERFPVETVEKMAKLGIFGIPFPVNYGVQAATTSFIRWPSKSCRAYAPLRAWSYRHTRRSAPLRFMSTVPKNRK